MNTSCNHQNYDESTAVDPEQLVFHFSSLLCSNIASIGEPARLPDPLKVALNVIMLHAMPCHATYATWMSHNLDSARPKLDRSQGSTEFGRLHVENSRRHSSDTDKSGALKGTIRVTMCFAQIKNGPHDIACDDAFKTILSD